MNSTIDLIILFLTGLFLIIKGGDWFVDGAIWIAKKTKIPSLIIGSTIVSIGTTIPEICVSVISIIKSKNLADPSMRNAMFEMSVGNAIGSMMCNIGLILAIVCIIRPPKTNTFSFKWKSIFLALTSLLLVIFSFTNNSLSLVEGIILLTLFFIFIAINLVEANLHIKNNRAEQKSNFVESEQLINNNSSCIKMIIYLIIGAIAIGIGANLLVDKGQALAVLMGIPTQIVAVTLVSIGTSLPELVTSIVSLKKKDANIGIGNIIGANIINSTLLLGLTASISGNLPIDYITKNLGIFVMLALTLIIVIPSIIKKKTYKWQGFLLLSVYIGYLICNIIYVAVRL